MRRAGVLGKPIDHSLSPVLHRVAYEALGLTDWEYTRHTVDADELEDFLAGCDESWRGLSLTMPLKEQALLLAAEASPLALQTGSVNTLVRVGRGWYGDNTDVHGLQACLVDAGVCSTIPGGHAVIIGSGATARSVLAAFTAFGVKEVTFVVRHRARESTLAQARDHGFAIDVRAPEDAVDLCLRTGLLVSAVPAGAADGLAAALEGHAPLPSQQPRPVWLDVVYAGWPTRLAVAGRRHGAVLVPGIEMLIHQAAEQVRLMTGREPPLEAMQAAGRAVIA